LATETILLNGITWQVTKNLTAALKYFTQIRSRFQDGFRLWADAVCMYSYRTATKCCGNLRFRPQFCEGFGFASHCLDSNPQKPVRALGAPFAAADPDMRANQGSASERLRRLIEAGTSIAIGTTKNTSNS
jgi:hypothetical protein